jgi:putative membrane protein insertion efficiency factor
MKWFLLKTIRLYQKTLSPDSGWFAYRHPVGYCKFQPHCSEYAYQAINKYGAFIGVLKALNRIVRCHPWSKGGNDPLL